MGKPRQAVESVYAAAHVANGRWCRGLSFQAASTTSAEHQTKLAAQQAKTADLEAKVAELQSKVADAQAQAEQVRPRFDCSHTRRCFCGRRVGS